uniref:Tyrosine-protein phosphatase domain-containing protein n=1 Tax=Angiostrongylus cantonensis TaxID=6313 RepID=A0A0K0D1F9_ANGCA
MTVTDGELVTQGQHASARYSRDRRVCVMYCRTGGSEGRGPRSGYARPGRRRSAHRSDRWRRRRRSTYAPLREALTVDIVPNADDGPLTALRAGSERRRIDGAGAMEYLSVPESPPVVHRRRDLDGRRMWNDLRNKSVSELSLVFDMFCGSSPSSSQNIHPDRACLSTGNLQASSKKNRRRMRVHHTWKALSASNLARQYVLVQEEKAMQAVPTAPIDASKFVAYVTERRKKRILFKGEYLMINRSIDMNKCRCEVGSTMRERNPYADTLPYDYNRVILPRLMCDENSHYINASYVNSWLREKAYVVTQAVRTKPMNVEFWRMVWELGSNCIVMLTKVFDFMKVMCLQYWPLTRFTFGDIDVETIDTHTYAHFVSDRSSISVVLVRHLAKDGWEDYAIEGHLKILIRGSQSALLIIGASKI